MKLSTAPRKFRAAIAGDSGETARTGSPERINGSSSDDVRSRIAELAYTLYEQRGREDGHDVEDWIQAEQRVLALLNQVGAKRDESS